MQAVLRTFSFRLREPADDHKVNPASQLTRGAEAFWSRYMLRNRLLSRSLRVAAATSLYFFAALVLLMHTAGPPTMPFRGVVSQSWQMAVGRASVLLMLLLVFFVVDATVFCVQFVRELDHKFSRASLGDWDPTRSRWPRPALDHHRRKLNLDDRYLEPWLNMRFVAMRTQAVGELIWYPYIVISLLLVSRSAVFDRFGAPVIVDVLNAVSVLIVTACALCLRVSAERLRRHSIWRLTNDMIALRGGSDEQRQTAEQVDLLIEKIRTFREGAFAPYSQQPLVRALLLPLSGLGGTAVLEMMIAADL